MTIVEMKISSLNEYAELFMSVFNGEPWKNHWTIESATLRIKNMIETNTFFGRALYEKNMLIGMVWGQKEVNYNGLHFHLQEFCIKGELQQKGYGTFLLDAFYEILKEYGIKNIYLLTLKGERTEGFYKNKGFQTSDNMVLMSRKVK